jgi:ankyrin repeat protein
MFPKSISLSFQKIDVILLFHFISKFMQMDQLLSAIDTYKEDIVAQILKNSKNIDLNVLVNRFSPLHRICMVPRWSSSIVSLMLEKGANPNFVTNNSETALHIVCDNKMPLETIKILLEHGANPNIQDIDGNTPLRVVNHYGNMDQEKVKLLVEFGADLNIKGYLGKTPLIYICQYGTYIEPIKLYIDVGADPNIKDDKGKTALMYACRKKSQELINLLLQCGADPMIADYKGRTVSNYAEVKLYYSEQENKRLRDEIAILKASPLPGIEFMNLFLEEYPSTDDFIKEYIPLLTKNITKYHLK